MMEVFRMTDEEKSKLYLFVDFCTKVQIIKLSKCFVVFFQIKKSTQHY